MSTYRYRPNSSDPLQPGEELARECEIGLDEEIIYYIRQNHDLQIRVGGEPFYLFQRQSGSAVSGTLTSWAQTSPSYIGTLWTPSDGESKHPDVRINKPGFVLFNNGVAMTRVFDLDFIAADTEYYIETQVGTSSTDKGTVRVHFNEGFVPGVITYRYNTLCSCVDIESGYPNRECPICKGTSYPVSFVQYECDATKYNPINTILVRVPIAGETRPVDRIGRVKVRRHKHWARFTPYIRNYDLILGTIGRNENVLFEVIGKYDSRVRGILLHQEFDTLRINETDVRYTLIPKVS